MGNRAVIVLFAITACSNKLSSDVEINGKKLALESCRNGSVYNFRGVELVGDDGTKLRIAATPSGEVDVSVLPPGGAGKRLGPCARLDISDQNSTINDVKNVEGSVIFGCTGDPTIRGTAKFANCH